MNDIRQWLDRGNKSADRMPTLIPLLIRQAMLETPITYGDVADEMGIHHRGVDRIAGYIGYTLDAVGSVRGWKKRPPPPLHSLIVNDVTGLPGRGINGFMSDAYQRARKTDQKHAVLKAVYAELKAYEYWPDLCELLDLKLDAASLGDAVEKARQARARGGEGPEHKALKKFIASNPHIVGLRAGSAEGRQEYPLASGDRVDVVFERRSMRFAVEVKPASAAVADKLRGVFQCLKYRVILRAEAALSNKPNGVKVLLALGGDIPAEVKQLANRLGIDVQGGFSPD